MLTHIHFGVSHASLTKKCSFEEECEFYGQTVLIDRLINCTSQIRNQLS